MIKSQLALHGHLKRIFGFSSFKGQQEQIIKNLQDGNDSLVIMPTGGGKSMCYQLPALIDDGVAIIVSPLIALMKNQVDALRGFNENDSIAHVLNSSLNKQQVQDVKDDLTSDKTKLLYVAPESLTKEEYILFLIKNHLFQVKLQIHSLQYQFLLSLFFLKITFYFFLIYHPVFQFLI